MTNGWSAYIICSLLMMSAVVLSDTRLRLFMPAEETERLIGQRAEVTYIYGSTLQQRAINSYVQIGAGFTDHTLIWQSLTVDPQVHYTIEILPDNPDGLYPVLMNITATGVIPNQKQAFTMNVNCTGRRPAVTFGIRFNFTNFQTENAITSIILQRKKICVSSSIPSATSSIPYKVDTSGSGRGGGSVNIPTLASGGYIADADFQSAASGVKTSKTGSNMLRPTSTEIFYVAVGVASAIIILVAVVICILYIKTKKHAQITNDRPSVIGSSNRGSSLIRTEGHKNSSLMSLPSSRRGTISSYSQLQPAAPDSTHRLESIIINRQSVVPRETLIEGAFGKLQHGIVCVQDEAEHCYNQKVLIKSLDDSAPADLKQLFLQEASVLKGFNNQFINPVIAACLEGPAAMLIYSYCERGNLKLFLKKAHGGPDVSTSMLNTQALVNIAIQIANGLHYLHRKHVIHKDVAARNCYIDSNFSVKLCDSALSCDIFPEDYSTLGDNESKPVKWMSIESLTDARYSHHTDTWSFGVLLWELIMYAQQPYSDVDSYEIPRYLLSGYRLIQPSSCPDELYAVMAYCWAMQPTDRPSITQILTCLQEFHKTLQCFI